jgi:hypothetical protein
MGEFLMADEAGLVIQGDEEANIPFDKIPACTTLQ